MEPDSGLDPRLLARRVAILDKYEGLKTNYQGSIHKMEKPVQAIGQVHKQLHHPLAHFGNGHQLEVFCWKTPEQWELGHEKETVDRMPASVSVN